MLPPRMRPRPVAILISALAALALAGAVSACGEEEETEVVEGEPVEVGELEYNISLTRFLNPHDNEDSEYLVGLPDAEPGTSYLGVFLTIENETSEPQPSADRYTVHDTLDTEYEPVESESPYALDAGEGELPLPDTTAATGPNQGSLLIFHVDDTVSENRPLTLGVEASGDNGEVVLDI
jgi:hypothetical protein